MSTRSYCENCGYVSYNGLCTYCDEETYIEDQYFALGESAPQIIADIAAEQRNRRDINAIKSME